MLTNMSTLKFSNAVGSSLKISSPEIMDSILKDYFDNIPTDKITITGVCLALDIEKTTFYDYAKRPEYKKIVNRARMLVENAYELSLRENGRAGDIFALKNFGWTDKQELEVSGVSKVGNSTPEERVNNLELLQEMNEKKIIIEENGDLV